MENEYYDPWSNTRTKHGLEADLVISALQKCIRRGQEDLAVRMAYELSVTSEFHEEKMWNRLLIISVEDVGFGNPRAAILVKTLFDMHKEFSYGGGDRRMLFVHAIRYMCRSQKDRSSCDLTCILDKESRRGYVPEIPDYAYDMHTMKGRAMGRDVFYFLDEASKVEPLWDAYDPTYRDTLYKLCKEERDAAEKD